jgi:hypothetical protein
VGIRLLAGAGDLRHGSEVRLHTTEPAVGRYADLGAFKSPQLYYYLPGYDQQRWVIFKRDPSDPVVHYGDQLRFYSPYWKQWLTTADGSYLTTRADEEFYWVLFQ